jgi:membrane protease YdiL (CAAX protease family)
VNDRQDGQPDEGIRSVQEGVQERRPELPGWESDDEMASQYARRVPWTGLLILIVWLVGEVWLSLSVGMLQGTGWFGAAGPADASGPTPDQIRLMLWGTCLALPLRLASAVVLVRAAGQTRLADLGLTLHRLGRNLLVGVIAALVLAPLVYAVNVPVERLVERLSAAPPQQHPFTALARHGLSPAEWLGLFLAAAVAAPLWEELFFRGLIQPWAIDRPRAGALLMGLAAALGVAMRWQHIRDARMVGLDDLVIELIPALTALALVPIYLFLRHRCRSPAPAGIFAASVLFGWFHARVWPTPVPLTILALGLGWLAWRSRSLVGAIAGHAVFNTLACLILVFEPQLRRALGG